MKKCPFCAEEIQNSAIKCKHCGEFLKKEEDGILGEKRETFAIKVCPKCGDTYDLSWKLLCIKCAIALETKRVTGEFLEGKQKTSETPIQNSKDITNPRAGKNLMLIGVILSIGGCVAFIGGSTNPESSPIGAMIFFIGGCIIYLVGRFQNWYHWQ